MAENTKSQLIVILTTCSESNNSNSSSEEYGFEESMSSFIYAVITLTLIPLNIAGNAFALYIFSLKVWKKSCMSYLLKALSLTEVLFQFMLLTYTLVVRYQIDSLIIREKILSVVASDIIMRALQCMLLTFQLARNWAVVSLAIFRFEAVCLDIGSKKVIVKERITCICSLILGLSFLISLPRAFEVGNTYCESTGVLVESTLYLEKYPLYQYGYISCIMFLCQSGGPIVLVCVFSGLVVRKIQVVNQFRRDRNMTERGSSSDKLVIAICFTFFLLEIPSFFSKLFGATNALSSPNLKTFDETFAVFANLCVYLDSTLNILIYMTSNHIFRVAALQKFGISVEPETQPVNV